MLSISPKRKKSKRNKKRIRNPEKVRSDPFPFSHLLNRQDGFNISSLFPIRTPTSVRSCNQNTGDGGGDDLTSSRSTGTRDNIRVLIRIRPKNDTEKKKKEVKTIVKALDEHTLLFDPPKHTSTVDPTLDLSERLCNKQPLHQPSLSSHLRHHRPNKNLRLTFDHVFSPSQSNVEIFETVLKSIVNHVLNGFNCSVFAYGATGSGKTFTMLGSPENPGLTFLTAKELSRRITEMAHEFESEVLVSYLEVYNETIKDLLFPSSGQLSIREDGINGVTIPNLTIHKINDTWDLLRMLSYGNSARTQHPTDANAESSRSHAVFQIFVTLRKRITHVCLNYKITKAKLVMVDLAGSERGTGPGNSILSGLAAMAEGLRCREGGNINKSLLALGNCINALADGKKHIPYRDSKLTRLLKDSLGGNCKTVMIANVAPTNLNFDDTYNTLKYADRAKEIRIERKDEPNLETTALFAYGKLIDELQTEVQQLQCLLQKEKERGGDEVGKQPVVAKKKDSTIVPPPAPQEPTKSELLTTSSAVAHDPEILENFIQLLGQKKKLEEAHVEASINAKRSEWKMMLEKRRIESLQVLTTENNNNRRKRRECGDRKHSDNEKISQYQNLKSDHVHYLEKVELSRRLVEFNDKEIDQIERTYLSCWGKDDPFLTVTLREFLLYKTLDREVGTHQAIENFHQQMCRAVFEELLQTQIILSDNLKFSQHLQRLLQRHNIPLSSKLNPMSTCPLLNRNGPKENPEKIPSSILLSDSVQTILEMIKNPIVDYDSSRSFPNEKFQHHQRDSSLQVIFPNPPSPIQSLMGPTPTNSEVKFNPDVDNESMNTSEEEDNKVRAKIFGPQNSHRRNPNPSSENTSRKSSSGSSIVPVKNRHTCPEQYGMTWSTSCESGTDWESTDDEADEFDRLTELLALNPSKTGNGDHLGSITDETKIRTPIPLANPSSRRGIHPFPASSNMNQKTFILKPQSAYLTCPSSIGCESKGHSFPVMSHMSVIHKNNPGE